MKPPKIQNHELREEKSLLPVLKLLGHLGRVFASARSKVVGLGRGNGTWVDENESARRGQSCSFQKGTTWRYLYQAAVFPSHHPVAI